MSDIADWWDRPKPQSIAKAKIVTRYFVVWANIMQRSNCGHLTYLDIFSGRGRYKDGSPSTPVRILDELLSLPQIWDILELRFYEGVMENYEILRQEICNHEVYHKLKYKPNVQLKKVDYDFFSDLKLGDCTFSFIDPHGNRDLSLELISGVVRNWGSDCVFYLSISGIRRNIGSRQQRDRMKLIFTPEGVKRIHALVQDRSNREPFHEIVLQELKRSLESKGRAFVLPFVVKFPRTNTVSHCLVFLTKHPRGFEKMKDIMADESEKDGDGFPLYVLSTDDQLKLGLGKGLERTARRLLSDFEGKTVRVRKLLDACHERRYDAPNKNLKDSVLFLEEKGLVHVDVPREKRMRGGVPTLGDDRIVTFE